MDDEGLGMDSEVSCCNCSRRIATSFSNSSLALERGEEEREEGSEGEDDKESWDVARERRGEVGGVQSFLRVVCTVSSSCSSSDCVFFHPLLRGERGSVGVCGGVVDGGRGVSGRAVQGSSKSFKRQKPFCLKWVMPDSKMLRECDNMS